MPKLKSNKAAKKRFKVTGGGKIVRRKAFKSHLLAKKTRKRKRGLRRATEVSAADDRRVRQMLAG